jgi:hypothetical protein
VCGIDFKTGHRAPGSNKDAGAVSAIQDGKVNFLDVLIIYEDKLFIHVSYLLGTIEIRKLTQMFPKACRDKMG